MSGLKTLMPKDLGDVFFSLGTGGGPSFADGYAYGMSGMKDKAHYDLYRAKADLAQNQLDAIPGLGQSFAELGYQNPDAMANLFRANGMEAAMYKNMMEGNRDSGYLAGAEKLLASDPARAAALAGLGGKRIYGPYSQNANGQVLNQHTGGVSNGTNPLIQSIINKNDRAAGPWRQNSYGMPINTQTGEGGTPIPLGEALINSAIAKNNRPGAGKTVSTFKPPTSTQDTSQLIATIQTMLQGMARGGGGATVLDDEDLPAAAADYAVGRFNALTSGGMHPTQAYQVISQELAGGLSVNKAWHGDTVNYDPARISPYQAPMAVPAGIPAAAPTVPAAAVMPPVPGAQKAPDGFWYVEQNGKFFRVDPN